MNGAQSLKRGMAAAMALGLSTALAPIEVQAEAGPLEEEWWFKAWSIQSKVWPLTKGRGVIVGLVDTGVNSKLPDLAGVVLRGTDVEAGGDGRKDYDSRGGGHGTAMAALIAAQGRGSGMLGVAPEARILPVGTFGGDTSWAEAIRYAANHGAKVINISQGVATDDPCVEKLQTAIDYAIRRDVVVVTGAGNEGYYTRRPDLPAKCHGMLVVGSVDQKRNIWKRSSYGSFISAAAPGANVGSIGKNGVFDPTNNGTSQASALTSGVVALIRSKYPKMPARQVVQRIIATAKDTGPAGWDDRTGYGTIIPYRALTDKVPSNAPNPVFDRLERWRSSMKKPVADSTPHKLAKRTSPRSNWSNNSNYAGYGLFAGGVLVVAGAALIISRGVRRSPGPQGRQE